MSAAGTTVAGGPTDREQLLDALEVLAGVEHALVVEHLVLACVLGSDLAEEEGGPISDRGRQAAGVAASLAQGEMFHLGRVCRALVEAGRTPSLGRAASVEGPDGAAIPFDPPGGAQLEHVVVRAERIAAAVDAAYTRLAPAVTSAPLVEGDLLETLRGVVVDDGPHHAAACAALREALGDAPPSEFLRVARREPADGFEQRLQDVGDRGYHLVVTALRERFGQPDFFVGGAFRQLAVSAMLNLDDMDRLLVQRGLLPAFSAP